MSFQPAPPSSASNTSARPSRNTSRRQSVGSAAQPAGGGGGALSQTQSLHGGTTNSLRPLPRAGSVASAASRSPGRSPQHSRSPSNISVGPSPTQQQQQRQQSQQQQQQRGLSTSFNSTGSGGSGSGGGGNNKREDSVVSLGGAFSALTVDQLKLRAERRSGVALEQYCLPGELDEDDDAMLRAIAANLPSSDDDEEFIRRHMLPFEEQQQQQQTQQQHRSISPGHRRQQSSTTPQPTYRRFEPTAAPALQSTSAPPPPMSPKSAGLEPAPLEEEEDDHIPPAVAQQTRRSTSHSDDGEIVILVAPASEAEVTATTTHATTTTGFCGAAGWEFLEDPASLAQQATLVTPPHIGPAAPATITGRLKRSGSRMGLREPSHSQDPETLEKIEQERIAMLRRQSSGNTASATTEEHEEENNQASLPLSMPLWPAFSPRLAADVTQPQRNFDELFAVPAAALTAHQFGNTSVAELSESTSLTAAGSSNSMGSMRFRQHQQAFAAPLGSPPAKKAAKSNNVGLNGAAAEELKEEEEEEEMMEVVEAAPVRSKTHAAVAPRKQYYFEQKQILDRQAGTLEAAAPAIVAAAVRANQSPFAPWCSFHDEMVEAAGASFLDEVQKLLAEATGTPSDVGGIMATPLAFNTAWRSTGVMIHPRSGLMVINPAVAVHGAVMARSDAALKVETKAVTIRGQPQFERSVQTSLTKYHEVDMFNTISRNALLQKEQVARMGLMTERSFAVVHCIALEQHARKVTQWNIDKMKQIPRNILSRWLGTVREEKGQRVMLVNLLQVPTSDGRVVKQILAPDQVADFDRAIALADRLIVDSTAFSIPLQQLVKMEEQARQQEVRCFEAWVSSTQHLQLLILMSFARRSSCSVRGRLSTKTPLDGKIAAVQAALAAASKTAA